MTTPVECDKLCVYNVRATTEKAIQRDTLKSITGWNFFFFLVKQPTRNTREKIENENKMANLNPNILIPTLIMYMVYVQKKIL